MCRFCQFRPVAVAAENSAERPFGRTRRNGGTLVAARRQHPRGEGVEQLERGEDQRCKVGKFVQQAASVVLGFFL